MVSHVCGVKMLQVRLYSLLRLSQLRGRRRGCEPSCSCSKVSMMTWMGMMKMKRRTKMRRQLVGAPESELTTTLMRWEWKQPCYMSNTFLTSTIPQTPV